MQFPTIDCCDFCSISSRVTADDRVEVLLQELGEIGDIGFGVDDLFARFHVQLYEFGVNDYLEVTIRHLL